MNNLLIFFAFPIAVIIISVILQKLLNCPVAVAALIFAIFLVVTFAAFDETFLIATLAYTILAFITAFIVKLICQSNNNKNNNNICECLTNILSSNLINNGNTSNSVEDILNTSNFNVSNSNCNNNSNSNINNTNNSCCCRNNRYRRF